MVRCCIVEAFDGGAIAYEEQTYDAATNTVTGDPASGNPISYFNGTRWTFDWESGRQLASASTTDGDTTIDIAYTYDINGLRTSKTITRTTVTNNDEESWSPALICDLELYQDGIGLPYPTTWDLEEPTAEDEAYETELEPGETVDCNALYYLRNKNPVEAVVEYTGGVTLGACFDVQALFDAAAAADRANADAATAAEAAARKALVGTWLQRDSDWEDTYIFNADGSGMLISGPEYPFTYSVSGGKLTLDYGDDDEEEFTFSVEGDLLTMIDMWDEELLLDKQVG